LLGCASDGLSAAGFAEYLSFGQVPARTPGSADPKWVGPSDELFGAAVEDTSRKTVESAPEDGTPDEWTIALPWKWETLLVDAAVISGAERWRRRLAGLDCELALRQAEVADEDPDAPRLVGLTRARASLSALREFALPVIDRLAA